MKSDEQLACTLQWNLNKAHKQSECLASSISPFIACTNSITVESRHYFLLNLRWMTRKQHVHGNSISHCKSKSSELFLTCTNMKSRSLCTHLETPVVSFNKSVAQAKLPTWQWVPHRSANKTVNIESKTRLHYHLQTFVYRLTNVSPNPNSLPDNVLRTDQLTKALTLNQKLAVMHFSIWRDK